MRIGDLEIIGTLNGNEKPFSSQADVYLHLEIKNLGDKAAIIPYFNEHPATYLFKDKQTGIEKKIVYKAPAAPGTPSPEPHPEAVVEAGETVTYKLLTQFPLGFIPAGEYSLQYGIDFPTLSFKTDWLDFKVLSQSVGGYSITPSSTGKSLYLYLAWSDMAATPNRIVFQRSFIGKNKPLLAQTFAIGEAENPSTPIGSTSPLGHESDIAWVGWIAKGQVGLARINAINVVKSAFLKPPEKTAWTLIPNLNYSHDAQKKDSILTGLLVGKDDNGLCLTGFLVGRPSGPMWMPTYRLPAGTILGAKLLPIGSHNHLAVWARYEGGKVFVEALDWDEALGFGKSILNCGTFPMALKAFKSFEATVQAPAGQEPTGQESVDKVSAVKASSVKWALASHEEAPDGEPSSIKVISHSINIKGHRTGPGGPKTKSYPAHAGPLNVSLKFDTDGTLWVLQRDVHGPWVQSSLWSAPVAVNAPPNSKFEDLFFRNGIVPKVMSLNPDSGFKSTAVDAPIPENE